jgi:hypothetical protein
LHDKVGLLKFPLFSGSRLDADSIFNRKKKTGKKYERDFDIIHACFLLGCFGAVVYSLFSWVLAFIWLWMLLEV